MNMKRNNILSLIVILLFVFGVTFQTSAINLKLANTNADQPHAVKTDLSESVRSSDILEDQIWMQLKQNSRSHKDRKMYSTIMVEDKIRDKYENMHYWANKYFKYETNQNHSFPKRAK